MSDSSSDGDWNGQTQLEFWASFVLCAVGLATMVFGLFLWKDSVRRRLLRRYQQNGVLVQAAVIDSKVTVVERRKGGDVIARFVGGSSVTIEYDAPSREEETASPILLGSNAWRLRKTVRSEGRLLYDELLRTTRENLADDINSSDDPHHCQSLEVIVLPEHPMSAYPRLLVEHELGGEVPVCAWILLSCLILLTMALLGTSVALQLRKEKWDPDFDIGPIVWMILLYCAIFLLPLVMLGIYQDTQTVLLKRATKVFVPPDDETVSLDSFNTCNDMDQGVGTAREAPEQSSLV